MDRVFESGAVLVAPPAPPTPSTGYPTGGNPGGGVPATKPGPWWYHMITEEMRAIVAAAGLTPDHTVVNQLLQALPAALASRPEMARSLAVSGYQKLPGGLILQWGDVGGTPGTYTLPIAFPTKCLLALAGDSDSAPSVCSAAPATAGPNVTQITVWGTDVNFWFAIGH